MNSDRFILGTAQFGLHYGINNVDGKPTRSKVFDILRYASQSGIRQLDSADQYGNAHQVIGEFISSGDGTFQINSKFSLSTDVSIRNQLQKTLGQLNSTSVNVYFYHRFDEMIRYRESLKELSAFKEEKLINKTGISIYTNDEFEASIHEPLIDVIQIPFNLLDNFSWRGELIQRAKERNKEIHVRSVFLQGLFFKEANSFPPFLKTLTTYISQLKTIANNFDLSMEELALKYVMGYKEIDGIIIGVDSVEQLSKNLSFSQSVCPADIAIEVEKIFVSEAAMLYPFNWK